ELTTSAFGGLWFACQGRYLCDFLIPHGPERNDNITRLRGHSADRFRVVLVRYRGKADMQRDVGPIAWSQMTHKRHKPARNPAMRRKGSRRTLRPHACCGVVSNVCCDVSAPRGAAFNPSAAPLLAPKLAIACPS